MYQYISIKNMELLSLTLVSSYFILNNIYLVITGICIALYLINKDNIENLIKNSMVKLIFTEKDKGRDQDNQEIYTNSEEMAEDKNLLTLEETIEIYGFIPSIDKDKNTA